METLPEWRKCPTVPGLKAKKRRRQPPSLSWVVGNSRSLTEGVKGQLSCTPEACWENSRGKRVERAQPLENGA